MKKEAQVVMLPNKEGAILVPHNLRRMSYRVNDITSTRHTSHHLYIVDDSEIKEGDYCIENIGGTVFGPYSNGDVVENPKKIIGTTDTQLLVQGFTPEGSKEWKSIFELPSIPTSFIESYCKNPVEKVMVEYEEFPKEAVGDIVNIGGKNREVVEVWRAEGMKDKPWYFSTPNNHSWSCTILKKPKLTSKNEIIIHPIMELTGKCKSLFEKWYLILIRRERKDYDRFSDEQVLAKFYRLLPSQQWGIIQDWADSMGLSIEIHKHRWEFNEWRYDADVFDGKFTQDSTHKTRQEARNAAIEKLNEMINKE